MPKRTNEITDEIIDTLLADRRNPEDLLGNDGLLQQLTHKLIARSLHLQMHGSDGKETSTDRLLRQHVNSNEYREPNQKLKKLKARKMPLGLDSKILSMYAKGLTPREIQEQVLDFYGIELSASAVANVTDAAVDEMKVWQSRALDPVYPIVYLDCIHVRVRDGASRPKAVYVVIGISITGQKEAIGLWISQNEGAKFWLQVLTEIKNRGVQEIHIACVDGLKGFPESVN